MGEGQSKYRGSLLLHAMALKDAEYGALCCQLARTSKCLEGKLPFARAEGQGLHGVSRVVAYLPTSTSRNVGPFDCLLVQILGRRPKDYDNLLELLVDSALLRAFVALSCRDRRHGVVFSCWICLDSMHVLKKAHVLCTFSQRSRNVPFPSDAILSHQTGCSGGNSVQCLDNRDVGIAGVRIVNLIVPHLLPFFRFGPPALLSTKGPSTFHEVLFQEPKPKRNILKGFEVLKVIGDLLLRIIICLFPRSGFADATGHV
eukprot:5481628-Amphidinium_carterae.2